MSHRTRVSRPFPVGRWLLIPAALMALMLVFDTSTLDFWFSDLFYVPSDGFVGRHSFFLEDILHDRVKQAVIVIGVLAIIGFVLSLLPTRLRRWRPELSYLVLSLALATSLVTPLKQLTNVPCPWSLVQYGGTEIHTPLLSARPDTNKAGRCWPGGHASSGFSLLALFFALRDRFPRAARGALIGALALGTVLSLGRTMQGAHFLSHNVWTLLFDWCICLLCYRLLLYRPAVAAHNVSQAGELRHEAA
ncbi:phosphatase PAP2 family protein [Halopseudomonas aestusnigri]|jgi:membrane-associated PAP2 superfamily phosphatase|uniref:phosphatase PAP2 family protein n=1 Tax=Halopseudomonas TaxID=2901189 RepID=UPI001E3144FE|nr:phosphatase PAP2 family protein [Halopseudomonas aestusnigri]MEE2799902.1 phosphatase PAP2 family protein [Pseudomonadota bacterium]UGV30464.1 phosphatase PAP2 family protein [Halopseudomonas aestusnigri]|tara:strand:- start:1897 stop:2640 length:744 start_codon:yes stop_codon:yes gene_type:complete